MRIFSFGSHPCSIEFSDTAVFPDKVLYHLHLSREHANGFTFGPENGAIFLGTYGAKNLDVSLGAAQE